MTYVILYSLFLILSIEFPVNFQMRPVISRLLTKAANNPRLIDGEFIYPSSQNLYPFRIYTPIQLNNEFPISYS